MRDDYNAKVLQQMLDDIRTDEYAIARLHSDHTKNINLDEGALQLLIDYYSGGINACSKISSYYVKASGDTQGCLGYGIDYRDMHTALHGIMWTPDKSLIKQIERICQELTSDNLPKDDYYEYWGELEGYFASNELFDEEEINFRDITSDNKYYCGDGYIQIINQVAFDLYF